MGGRNHCLSYISIFISEIYAARAAKDVDLKEKLADELAEMKEWCQADKERLSEVLCARKSVG